MGWNNISTSCGRVDTAAQAVEVGVWTIGSFLGFSNMFSCLSHHVDGLLSPRNDRIPFDVGVHVVVHAEDDARIRSLDSTE